MKYKVGDKVRIKSIDWYNKNKDKNGWIWFPHSSIMFLLDMSKFCGMTATIISEEQCLESFYKIDIGGDHWCWTDEMFDETYNENKMESKKVKITLPKNCEVDDVKASVEDGYLVVEYTPKEKFSPKDGDILSNETFIVIYKGTYNITGGIICHCYLRHDGVFSIFNGNKDGRGCGFTKEYREATKEEKESILNRLKEKGYTFNQETKKVEKIRWRAERENSYYFINSSGNAHEDDEDITKIDSDRFEIGNYFQTKEEAQEYANKFKELLKNRL